jgi:hypothetical protein
MTRLLDVSIVPISFVFFVSFVVKGFGWPIIMML